MLLTQGTPSFEKVVEVLRAMVASEVAPCCPCTQTLSHVPHREQLKYLVALRGDNRRRRSNASHVEHAGPGIIHAPRERDTIGGPSQGSMEEATGALAWVATSTYSM